MKKSKIIILSLIFLTFMFINITYSQSILHNVSVNSIVTMGKYNKDNLVEKEDIEWVVIGRDENKVLLLSRYIIDCMPFSLITKIGYINSQVRKFLNEDFLNSFTNEEKSKILPTSIIESNNINRPAYASEVNDLVFLLNANDIKKHILSENGVDKNFVIGIGTEYAKSKGLQCVNIMEDFYTSPYWLSSHGFESCYEQVVAYNGEVLEDGYFYHRHNCGVRPAMWVEVDMMGD